MAGGIKQLTLKGALDYNFIGNPQISFFKVVYRRYTNFALESLDISLSRKTILDNDDITSIPSIIIPRNADLLSNVYLTFTLPNIYSGCYNADGDETSKINNIPYEFKWVENIGTNLIESAKLYIGTTEVNNIPGKLMQVLSEINYDDSKKKIYDDMIGNIPEIYNPKLNRSDKHKKFIAILTDQGDSDFASQGNHFDPVFLDRPITTPVKIVHILNVTNLGDDPINIGLNSSVGITTVGKYQNEDNIPFYVGMPLSISAVKNGGAATVTHHVIRTVTYDLNQRSQLILHSHIMTLSKNDQMTQAFLILNTPVQSLGPDFDDTTFTTTTSNGKIDTLKVFKTDSTLEDHYRTFIGNGTNSSAQALILQSDYPHMMGSESNQHEIYDRYNDMVIAKNSEFVGNRRLDFIPSIHKKKCKVPLPFYFTKNPGLSIPLIALPKSEVKIDLTLNNIKKLYTISKMMPEDTDNLNDKPKSISSFTNLSDTQRKVFRVKPPSELDITTFIADSAFDLNLNLEATYIYLDNEERRRFARETHNYLIEEYQTPNGKTKNIGNSTFIKFNNINYPVKELIIVPQRNDMNLINNWNNYTNWTIEDVAPYSEQYQFERMYYSDSLINKYLFYNKHGNDAYRTSNFKMKYFHKNIIEKMYFTFDTTKRQETRDSEYYNLIQPYEHHSRKIKEGIHLFSFSLNPNEYQPSGHSNFSVLNHFQIYIDLGIETGKREVPPDLTYNFDIYAISYNILSIQSGIGAKQYCN